MTRPNLLVLAALAALTTLAPTASHAGPGSGGTVKGKVVVVKGGKAVDAEAWVYLERTPRPRRPRPRATLPRREIRQVKEQFEPHILVVPVGTVVAFPNYDLQEHNVFSPTDPPGQFDLGRYNTDKTGKTHTFADAAEIEIYCDIHKAMWARVKVVDSEFIARVASGAFVLTGVPAGRYKLHAWTRDSVEVLEAVVVTDGGVTATSELHVQQGPERVHNRKDGQPYIGPGAYPR